jgi:hypothetical protein
MIRQFSFESSAAAAELPWLNSDRQLAPGLPGRTRESIETTMRNVTQVGGKNADRTALEAECGRFRFFEWLTVGEPNGKIGRHEGLSAATLPSETNC